MPPCAEPMLAPMRSCGRPSSPASASASCAAAVASCAQRSMRRESRRPKSASPSKSSTRQTGVGGSPSSSSTLAPETPSARAFQNASTPTPIELTTPTPVTTTLRPMGWSLPDAQRQRARCGGAAAPGCTLGLTTGSYRRLNQLSGPSPRRSLLRIPPCRPLAADGAATARPLWERTASTPITPETAWLRQRRSGRPDPSFTPTARTATWPRAWTRSAAIRSAIRRSIPPTTA